MRRSGLVRSFPPFLFLLICSQSLFAVTDIHPDPGVYGTRQYCSFPGEEGTVLYRVELEGEETQGWRRYQEAFLLSALPGEARSYLVKTKGGDSYRYLIDRKAPPKPQIDIDDERIRLSCRENGVEIFYRSFSAGGGEVPEFSLYRGEELRLQTASLLRIEAYSQDSAGNRSPISAEYMESESSSDAEIPILSPKEGIFLNPQLFYVDTEGYQWVRYTIDGEDPVIMGADYTEPLLIRSRGRIRLKLAALPNGSDSAVRDEVVFAQYPRDQYNLPRSGVYEKPLAFELPSNISSFSTVEDGPFNRENQGAFTVKGLDGAVRIHPFRFQSQDSLREGEEGISGYSPEYRYTYVVDRRKPAAPRAKLSRSLPFNKRIAIELEAGEKQEIFYTLNGSTPDRYALRYRRPIEIDAEEWGEQGAVELRALAYGRNGLAGRELRKLLAYDRRPPQTPILEIEDLDDGKLIRSQAKPLAREEVELVYEVSFDGEAPTPGPGSPRALETMELRFPKGIQSEVDFRLAAIDSAGNVQEAEQRLRFSLDSLPPDEPRITLNGSVLRIENLGEASSKIFYRYKLEEDPFTTWQEYNGAENLETPENTLTSVLIEAKSTDLQGVSSGIVSSDALQIDKRKAFGMRIEGLPSGGESGDSVLISARTEESASIRYRLLKNGVLQEEGEWKRSLLLEGEEGQETVYLLELTPFSRVDGRIGKPVERRLVIDREKPQVPMLPGLDGSFFGEHSGILLQTDTDLDKGDRLWLYCRPEQSGKGEIEPPGKKEFIEEGVEIHLQEPILPRFSHGEGAYRAYLYIEDVHGNSSLGTNSYQIVYDLTAPEIPIFRPEDKNGVWMLYYNQETDAQLLQRNSEGTVQDLPIVLDESDGLQRFYLLDKAGNQSDDVSFCVLDGSLFRNGRLLAKRGEEQIREADQSSLTARDEMEAIEELFSQRQLISGIPRFFWSREPVRIVPEVEQGVLRYELSLGSEARNVASDSDELDEALEIEAEEGDAFYVSLHIGLFARLEGKERKIDQRRYRFGIDRSAPRPPSVRGVEANTYYREDRRIELFSDEAEVQSIRYRVIDKTENRDPEQNFLTYRRPISVQSNRGSFSDYQLECYAVDEAGNHSPHRTVPFSIDKAVLYVADREDGKTGNGSRSDPYGDFSFAVKEALRQGMSTIILSSGEHRVEEAIEIGSGTELRIQGGYAYPEWKKNNEISALIAGPDLARNAVFTNHGGELYLERFSVDNLNSGGALLLVDEGHVSMRSLKLYQAYDSDRGSIRCDGGSLEMESCSFRYGPVRNNALIQLNNSLFSLKESEISSSSSGSNVRLIDGVQSEVNIDKSIVRAGGGDESTLVRLRDGSGSIIDSRFWTAGSDPRAVGLDIDKSELFIRSSSFMTGAKARLSFLIRSRNSTLNLERSFLYSGGEEGSVQLMGENSSIQSIETVFSRRPGAGGFIYGIQSIGGELNLANSIFLYDGNDDAIALDMKDSNIQMEESSIAMRDSEKGLSRIMRKSGRIEARLKANRFYTDDPEIERQAEQLIQDAGTLLSGFPGEHSPGEQERLFEQYPNSLEGESPGMHPAEREEQIIGRLLQIDPTKER